MEISVFSQQPLAEVLHGVQPAIAEMEKRTDMYLSTLHCRIEAMGGELEIVANSPKALSGSTISNAGCGT